MLYICRTTLVLFFFIVCCQFSLCSLYKRNFRFLWHIICFTLYNIIYMHTNVGNNIHKGITFDSFEAYIL